MGSKHDPRCLLHLRTICHTPRTELSFYAHGGFGISCRGHARLGLSTSDYNAKSTFEEVRWLTTSAIARCPAGDKKLCHESIGTGPQLTGFEFAQEL